MQIVVGERSFQANAILAAYLGASPDLAEVCATATKSPLQVWDKSDVQGATVQVMRTRSMTEIRIGVEPDLDLIFAFKPVEKAVMHLVYLGRDGHRANAWPRRPARTHRWAAWCRRCRACSARSRC